MFLLNKYTKWYTNIITNASLRIVNTGYTEKHHIMPKSLGGSNLKENLVVLTPREHFLCHLLLPKMVEGKARSKMAYAFFRFRKKNTNSRLFDKYRVAYGLLTAGENNKFFGKKHSDEAKARMREHARTRTPPRTGAIYSDELKLKLSSARKTGLTDGSIVPWNKGVKQSLNLPCPHCGTVCQSKWTLSRWHLDNCPKKKAA